MIFFVCVVRPYNDFDKVSTKCSHCHHSDLFWTSISFYHCLPIKLGIIFVSVVRPYNDFDKVTCHKSSIRLILNQQVLTLMLYIEFNTIKNSSNQSIHKLSSSEVSVAPSWWDRDVSWCRLACAHILFCVFISFMRQFLAKNRHFEAKLVFLTLRTLMIITLETLLDIWHW